MMANTLNRSTDNAPTVVHNVIRLGRPGVDCYCHHETTAAVLQLQFLINERPSDSPAGKKKKKKRALESPCGERSALDRADRAQK
ncbi:unnamed protein product [Boreogadus saida]